jgi:hypothetical protein
MTEPLMKLPFLDTGITAVEILDVKTISLIIHGRNTTYSPARGLFYIYCEKLSHQNAVEITITNQ